MRYIYSEMEIPEGADVAIYGAGSAGANMLRLLGQRRPDLRVRHFLDTFKSSGAIDGVPVHGPADLHRVAGAVDWIVVASIKREEIIGQLYAAGVANVLVAGPGVLEPAQGLEGLARAALADVEAAGWMPDVLFLQLSAQCNLDCVMCHRGKWGRVKRPFMDAELFASAVASASEMGVKTVYLHTSRGEPLLHPEALELIELAARRHAGVRLVTNANLLDDPAIERLAKAGLEEVRVSFFGHDKASYEALYRGGDFEVVLDNLGRLARALADTGTGLQVHGTSLSLDLEPLFKTRELLAGIGLPPDKVFGGGGALNLAGQTKLGRYWPVRGMHSLLPVDHLVRVNCPVLYQCLGVLCDGRVTCCPCMDFGGALVAGDLRQESLRDIAAGERRRATVTAYANGDLSRLEMCRRCDMPFHTGGN